MAQEPPAELVAVATVCGITEEPLSQVRPYELEELTLVRHFPARNLPTLQIRDQVFLGRFLRAREAHAMSGQTRAIEQREADAIDRPMSAIWARQSPVEVGKRTDCVSTGTGFAGRKHPREDRRRGQRLASGQ